VDTGVKISLAAHVGLIALGLSASFFEDRGEPQLEVLSVDFLSADEFAALTPDAPRASEAPTQPTTPQPEDPEVAIATPEPELEPVELEVEPEVLPEIPTAPETPEAPENPEVVAEPEPEVTPKQADRIAPEAAPKAPTDAEEAPVKVEAPKPEPKAEPKPEPAPVPEVVEQAPKEATTEIVTEADEPKTNAPLTSPTPKSRPKNLPKPKPKVAEKPKEEPKPKPVDNTANDILKAIEADQKKQADAVAKASTTNGTGGGNKLSKGEINGLILKVQDCWSVPVGLRNAANLVVTLSVELSPHGRLVDVPKIIEPTGSLSPEQQQAFESARRALIACQPYQLPQEKYESWNTMEVVFNPKKMVLRQ
jgi:hypothetical protein